MKPLKNGLNVLHKTFEHIYDKYDISLWRFLFIYFSNLITYAIY